VLSLLSWLRIALGVITVIIDSMSESISILSKSGSGPGVLKWKLSKGSSRRYSVFGLKNSSLLKSTSRVRIIVALDGTRSDRYYFLYSQRDSRYES